MDQTLPGSMDTRMQERPGVSPSNATTAAWSENLSVIQISRPQVLNVFEYLVNIQKK